MVERPDVERPGIDEVRRLMAVEAGDEKHDDSSTSTLDALWVLYDAVLRVDPARPELEERDRFILSKGHGPAAHYTLLAAKGFFPSRWLEGFLDFGQPSRITPGPFLLCFAGSASSSAWFRCLFRLS